MHSYTSSRGRLSPLHFIALCTGGCLAAVSWSANTEAVAMQPGASPAEYAMLVAYSWLGMITLTFAAEASRRGQAFVAVALCTVACAAMALDAYSTYERKTLTRELRLQEKRDANAPRRVAEAVVADATAAHDRLQAAVQLEIAGGMGKGNRRKRVGCGPKCRGLKSERDAAAKALAAARQHLASLPAAKAEVPETGAARLVSEVVSSMLLTVGAAVLFAYGIGGNQSRPPMPMALPAKHRVVPSRPSLTDEQALDLVLLRCAQHGGRLPEGVVDLASLLGWSTGRTSEATRDWHAAGLIVKRREGRRVVIEA